MSRRSSWRTLAIEGANLLEQFVQRTKEPQPFVLGEAGHPDDVLWNVAIMVMSEVYGKQEHEAAIRSPLTQEQP